MEKTAGRHPHLICMPIYSAHQLSCSLVHPDRRDVCDSPYNFSAWAWGRGECWLAGTELVWISVVGELCLAAHDEQSMQAQAHDEPRQVTRQLLALPGACGIPTPFL